MIYFDNAATTFPKPGCVPAVLNDCLKKYCGNPGRSSHKLSLEAARKIYGCREEICRHFGYSKPENITFTANATYALNTAIKTRVKPGDHILISDIEHNSVLRPTDALFRHGIAEYGIFPTAGTPSDIVNGIFGMIRENTSLIVVCHRSNICNRTLPLREISELCAQKGIKLIVDASQSAGSYKYELDLPEMAGVSALCAPGHKGLYGIQGTGFIINCDGGGEETLIEGGGGTASFDRAMPDILPDRLEPGTLNTPGIAALSAGLGWIEKIGTEQIAAHEERLVKYAAERLADMKDILLYSEEEAHGGILLFNHRKYSSEETAQMLSDAGICVRGGYHCAPLAHTAIGTREDGAVRISFGYFNSEKEIDRITKLLSGR